MDVRLTARWIVPITAPPIPGGAVVVRDGRIAACGTVAETRAADLETVDLGDVALLPGLVNVHAHLELTLLRGYVEDDDFFRWIRRLTRTKYEVLTPDDLLASSRLGALEMLRAGVTTVGEVCDLGVSRRAIEEIGMRAVVYQEVFGPDAAVAERAFTELEERVRDHQRGIQAAGAEDRVTVGVSPHAPYSVSGDLFRRVVEYASCDDLPVTIHAAESRAEREFVTEGTGPFADFLAGRGIDWTPPGVSTIEYLSDLGVLRTRPLLVHCVDASDEDLRRIAESGSTIAHCPKSNAKLGHGIARWGAFAEAGIPTGVATDSVASNNTADLFEELRVAELVSRGIGASARSSREMLRAITCDAGRALGFESELGAIEVGRLADLCAVDVSKPHVQPVHDIEAAVAWAARADDVAWCMVGGDVVYEAGGATRTDEGAVLSRVEEIRRGKLGS